MRPRRTAALRTTVLKRMLWKSTHAPCSDLGAQGGGDQGDLAKGGRMHPRIVSTPEGGCAQEARLRTTHTPKESGPKMKKHAEGCRMPGEYGSKEDKPERSTRAPKEDAPEAASEG